MSKPAPSQVKKTRKIQKGSARGKRGGRDPFPHDLEPMLATLVDKPVDGDEWMYEVKWDGYRALAYLKGDSVELRSRNNKPFNEKYYPLYEELKRWDLHAVLDGEIIIVDEQGRSDFSALQTWRSEADGQLLYYLFDILWLDGSSLMHRPLEERRKFLQSAIPENNSLVRISENFDTSGTELFQLAGQLKLEGIIAKKKGGQYIPGQRSKEWLKIKTEKRQEAIIGGYTKNENSSKQFSALLMGLFENGNFRFIGPVGTGFSNRLQSEILQKLKPLVTNVCPFSEVPEYNKPSRFRPHPPKAEVIWVKPRLVAEISYREETRDGAIRHPSFKGLREDKAAREVTREIPTPAEKIVKQTNNILGERLTKHSMKKERTTLLNRADESQVRSVGGHELKFTNLSKTFWPKEKVTKRDMINYYYQVAPYLLPYMKDRPQTLNRFPNGIDGESFYQKDITGKAPEWIEGFPYHSETDNRNKNFLVCTNEASLLYIASLGCIEMNPWSSRVQHPDNPDWCIIDLDPSEKNSFDQVIEAAQVTKQVLDELGVPSCCKTSGSTGMHIYIPLGAKYDYEASKEFARAIVKRVHAEIPGFTSIERLTEKRKGRLYLDFLQNRPQATIAAPYSLRPKPGATVSAPLQWEEVKKGLRMRDFNIFNMMNRLKETGDLFRPVLGKAINIGRLMKKMDAMATG